MSEVGRESDVSRGFCNFRSLRGILREQRGEKALKFSEIERSR